MKDSVIYKYRYYFIIIFILLVGGITFGYSKLMASLNIDANVKLGAVKWDVAYKDIVVADGSFTNDDQNYVRIDPESPNKLSYKITLNEAGNFYEFTVKVKNNGTINALLNNIIETGTDTDLIISVPYIDYSIEGLPSIGSTLNKDEEKVVSVRVEYLPDMGGTSSYTIEKTIELEYVEN